MQMNSEVEQICARCNCILVSGKDHFFEVEIKAVADPGSPDLADIPEEFSTPEEEYLNLVEQLKNVSGQEALDEIALTRVIYLCSECCQAWIEDPASGD